MIDLTGQEFGRLIVQELIGKNKHGQLTWSCLCACGSTKSVQGAELKSGDTKSCGCLRRELRTKHGQAKVMTREYRSWSGMKDRCNNPNRPKYKDYGGRGRKVCDRWLHSFENFFEDMGPCPPGMTLDRIDNDGDYEPGNCRWATRKEQQNNRRITKWYEYNGERKTVIQLAMILGMEEHTLYCRLHRGWSEDRAFNTLVRRTINSPCRQE